MKLTSLTTDAVMQLIYDCNGDAELQRRLTTLLVALNDLDYEVKVRDENFERLQLAMSRYNPLDNSTDFGYVGQRLDQSFAKVAAARKMADSLCKALGIEVTGE